MKKLLGLALIVGAIAGLARLAAAQKAKWEGLSESEVRAKLESRLPKWVPGEKRAEIADEIVSGMQQRGALRDEEDPSVGAPTDSGSGEAVPDTDDAEVSEDSGDITAPV